MIRPARLRPVWLVLRPVLAVVGVALTTAGLLALRPFLSTPIVALLYLLPVGLSTVLWGLVPGIVASLCAFLTFNFFFLPPYYTFIVHQSQDALALVVFLIVAIVVSELVGQTKASLAQAEARQRETNQLYELSLALVGLREAEAIAQTLADRVRDSFQAQAVKVTVAPAPGQPGVTAQAGAAGSEAQAQARAGLGTVRGLLGSLAIWRAEPLDAQERRLLNTFAGQGALAFEHALLAQAETHAKVLEESDKLKSALLSSVSHELRTLLATIKASVSGLRGAVDWDSEAREDLLAVMDEEVDHLNRLVGNLLDMSRIEAGALKPQRQWGLLAEIVGDTLSRMRRATAQHRVLVDIPEDLPLAPVDHSLLEQVFTNLIGNSVKYAPPDSAICIRARAQPDDTLLVQISNKGPHVAAEHLEHIFDKFHRVTDADRVTGTGLGLSICKGIVEAHGGRIWAENLPDGFAFNFTLPLTQDGAQPPQLPKEMEAA